ncbi:protein PXR1-like [Venturia canescens]|uniref:protein PXR1-like n=1 Tax=Venturia canescens TaxID=32260 RepID=UPI001C9D1B27|nr:protein PXR1-like [Venturia canescens]
MNVGTQTEGMVTKCFSQQTGDDIGEWDIGEEQTLVQEINVSELKAMITGDGEVMNISVNQSAVTKKRTQNAQVQTGKWGKDKAIQTDWVLRKIDIEDSWKSDREALLHFLGRHKFYASLKEEFKVPDLITPIENLDPEEMAEESKKWRVGEFKWNFEWGNEEQNKGKTQNQNNDETKGRRDKKEKKDKSEKTLEINFEKKKKQKKEDSEPNFNGRNQRYLETLLAYLDAEAKEKEEISFDKSEWIVAMKKDIPRQQNGYDCGVFICQYAKYEVAKREMNFSQKDIPQIRIKMMEELQQGTLQN